MKAVDRYIAIGEEGFVVEVINPDTTWDKNDETTFDATRTSSQTSHIKETKNYKS